MRTFPIFFIVIFLSQPALAGFERFIVVDKGFNTLTLFQEKKPVETFAVTLGFDPISDKERSMDGATPEGLYFISYKKPFSRFHRFLGISYPNPVDAWQAWLKGTISRKDRKSIIEAYFNNYPPPGNTRLGGGVGIHGGGLYRKIEGKMLSNWTLGCIALEDMDMERIFSFAREGDPVIIFDSRKNLYQMVRPFVELKKTYMKKDSICPDNNCVAETRFKTGMGIISVTLEENKYQPNCLTCRVFKNETSKKPYLVIMDRNVDGKYDSKDWISGKKAYRRTPQHTYKLIRHAILRALSKGNVKGP